MDELEELLVRWFDLCLMQYTDITHSKLCMSTKRHCLHSLRSHWRNQRVSNDWRVQLPSCTKLCKQARTGVSLPEPSAICTLSTFPDMAATFERLDEYKTHNAHFCKRILEYMTFMITAQVSPCCPYVAR